MKFKVKVHLFDCGVLSVLKLLCVISSGYPNFLVTDLPAMVFHTSYSPSSRSRCVRKI
jgi:hypothetical protein